MNIQYCINEWKLFRPIAIRYSALLIPSGLGCNYDLATHKDLGKILNEFIEDRSEYYFDCTSCDVQQTAVLLTYYYLISIMKKTG